MTPFWTPKMTPFWALFSPFCLNLDPKIIKEDSYKISKGKNFQKWTKIEKKWKKVEFLTPSGKIFVKVEKIDFLEGVQK